MQLLQQKYEYTFAKYFVKIFCCKNKKNFYKCFVKNFFIKKVEKTKTLLHLGSPSLPTGHWDRAVAAAWDLSCYLQSAQTSVWLSHACTPPHHRP